MDKAGKDYWDTAWGKQILPESIDPYKRTLENHLIRQLHQYFSTIFNNCCNGELLEIGCARSVWLPYFAQEFGFNVFGLDYSEIGCHYTTQILKREHIKGSVICADFNSPPKNLLNRFDVVFSNGVVEHFLNTEQCLKTFSRFLKKDGLMVTIIPNFKSIYGLLQKTLNKPVYDIHVALDINDLNTSHQQAGLDIVDSRYFLSNDFSLINLNGIHSDDWRFKSKKLLLRSLNLLSAMIWFFEAYSYNFSVSKSLSPYIVCTARKIL